MPQVFPRGSPLLPDVTKALLNVSERGKLRELETNMIASEKCVDKEAIDEIFSLSPSSFWVLFIFTAGTSTMALVFYVVLSQKWFRHKTIWRLMLAVMRHWSLYKKSFSRRVSGSERSRNSSNTPNSRSQV